MTSLPPASTQTAALLAAIDTLRAAGIDAVIHFEPGAVNPLSIALRPEHPTQVCMLELMHSTLHVLKHHLSVSSTLGALFANMPRG